MSNEKQEGPGIHNGRPHPKNEKVVDAKEDKAFLESAKAARFETTGEPEAAPSVEDVR